MAEAIIANHDWDCAIIAEGVRAGQAGFIDARNENGGTMIRARLWCEATRANSWPPLPDDGAARVTGQFIA